MKQQRRFVWAALILTIAAFLIQVIAVSLPFWQWTDVYETVSGTTTRLSHTYVQGLWAICDLEDDYSSCWHPSGLAGWMHAVRALETISMILLFLVAVLLTVYMSCFSQKLVFQIIAVAILYLCVILILAGVIEFGNNAENGYLHFAFAFAVLAAVLALIAAVLLLIIIIWEIKCDNKVSTDENRPKRSEGSNEARTIVVNEQRQTPQPNTSSQPTNRYNCGGCGKLTDVVYDKSTSTSTLSLQNDIVQSISVYHPDTVTRSTCMSPLGTNNQYKHKISPVYCGHTTPEGKFGTESGIHGPCPNSMFCCKCQHKFPAKKSRNVCDCIIGDTKICEKCKEKQKKVKETHIQSEPSTDVRPFFYTDEVTPKSHKPVEKSQSREHIKDTNPRIAPAANVSPQGNNRSSNNDKDKHTNPAEPSQSNPNSVVENSSEQELKKLAENTSRKEQSNEIKSFEPESNDEKENTNYTELTQESKLSEQESIVEEELKKLEAESAGRQNQHSPHKDQHLVKQNKNDDTTPRIVGQDDTSASLPTRTQTEQSRRDNKNPAKKVAKEKKIIQSRYAFDRNSGTLPNYSPDDMDDPVNRPVSNVSRKHSPVLQRSKRRTTQKKWDPPKWN